MGYSWNPSNSEITEAIDLIFEHTHIATHIRFVAGHNNNGYI